MTLGMSPFLFVHVALSLVGILTGLIVLYGMLTDHRMDGWTLVFLATTVATSLTGFLFPFHGFTPALAVGILSMIVLALAVVARYAFRMAGHWRGIYVVTAVIALYLNTFVLVVQAFQKVRGLHDLAPRGSEPPFAIAQGIVLVLFIVAGILAVRRFHPLPMGQLRPRT